MSTTVFTAPEFELAWSSSVEEDKRFKKWLKRLLVLLLLFLIVVPWLPKKEVDRAEIERVPPQLAKVILKKTPPPPPPPPKEEVVQQEQPKEVKATPKEKHEAREKVAKMGVAAFSKELSSLRSSLNVAKLQARNTNVTTGLAAKSSRSVLGRASAEATSGGVSTDALSQNGGTALAGRNATQVGDPFGGAGGGVGAGSGGSGKKGSTVSGGRDMESIRRVFEKEKGAIYALYNRELRKDPEIEGKFVFHIVIEPDGSISAIKLVSSELNNSNLEKRLLFRIQSISFGAEDVASTPVTYKFDFLPG